MRYSRVLLLPIAIVLLIAARPSRTGDQLTADQWREDLRYMHEELSKRHANLFHMTTREQFHRAVDQLYERIPSLQRHQIVIGLLRILAMVGDSHTRPEIRGIADVQKWGYRVYPLRLYLYRDGLFVQAAAPEYREAVGARVLKIGNMTADQALRKVNEIVPRDNEMTLKYLAPRFLVIPEALHALAIVRDLEQGRFVFESPGKKEVALQLKPVELTLPILANLALEAPVPLEPRMKWVDARDPAAPAPLWLKDPKNNYWYEYLKDSRTVYVQYNQVANKSDESIAEFFRRVVEFAASHDVDRFILDIRLNGGGDGYLNRPILHALIKSDKINQPGRLFTIIGRGTNSAAMMLAVDLEKHTNTLFVGEPTGGKPNHFGELGRLVLPNSGLTIGYASLFFQLSDPRDTRSWIAPHITAELSSEDYRKNRDAAFEAILQYRPRKRLSEAMMEALSKKGLALAIKVYKDFRADPQNKYADLEGELNRLGSRLMEMNRLDEAVKVLQFNGNEHPDSFLVYDRLGEAYLRQGDKELAIRSFGKSLELNPGNWNAVDRLRELRGK